MLPHRQCRQGLIQGVKIVHDFSNRSSRCRTFQEQLGFRVWDRISKSRKSFRRNKSPLLEQTVQVSSFRTLDALVSVDGNVITTGESDIKDVQARHRGRAYTYLYVRVFVPKKISRRLRTQFSVALAIDRVEQSRGAKLARYLHRLSSDPAWFLIGSMLLLMV